MDKIIEFVKEPQMIIILMMLVWILLIITIMNIIKLNKVTKKYNKFISKFSRGTNIEELLGEYAKSVENVRSENIEMRSNLDKINKKIDSCIQKVGIVRYNAFSDTGSDLCFALALLDFENNGVVINGVYSRDNTTTTYAKPVERGTSKYTLSKEEQEAIEQAKRMSESYYVDVK